MAYDPRTTTSRPATGGCGACGGSHPAPTPPASYDPCAGGIPAAKRSTEVCGGCGGSCGGACDGATRARTYDPAQCPTLAISCETKQALRDCAKQALCDFARCASEAMCPDGRFDRNVFQSQQTRDALIDCVGQLMCSFLHCVPDALCPPPCEPELPAPAECLPCDYAVEVRR